MNLKSEMMTLKQLLSGFVGLDCLPDIPLTGLCLDSRKVQSGNLFVALAGQKDHGLAFAELAVKNGAVAVLCDREFDQYCQQILSSLMTRVICVPVQNLAEKLGAIASRYYGHPSADLFTVGVTGTDGKTSVSHFIAQALDGLGKPSAVLGTVGNGLISQLQQASHTTPDVIQVHQLLAEYRQQGVGQVAMEVSSHGLDQRRVDAVSFDVAVLTNLGRDHLDYHGDIDTYREAKRQLFFMPGLSAAVLNLDDEFGRQLAKELKGKLMTWGYSLSNKVDGITDYRISAEDVEAHSHGLNMTLQTPRGEASLSTRLLGEFNVSNVMAALAVLLIKDVPLTQAVAKLAELNTVPGRMESFSADKQPLVVVDYAHTPQALGLALQTLKHHVGGARLHCVFGCGGDRDKGKRALMAAAAENSADRIIITDDNPRTEDGQQIIEDIQAGFKHPEAIEIIRDRKQAIVHAIESASEQDMVLIAGKGHEDYQIIGDIKYPFSDRQIVAEQLGQAS
ncbi:MAG: UDP-N-acetylmuramoyl-L-alanyl-D-glutamate--2,6-diaminopimelate ligase [Gammaproteobacteria bacterium]|nr:UDP-N-acetylmuramoyl-L-alanyl-D-glutamate--2,6-diaminopimelate ligase [Gammaproteobacteria bacterium]